MLKRINVKKFFWLLIVPVGLLCAHIFTMVAWDARPMFLWTDILVYILVTAIAAFGIYASNKEHLRDPWRQVLASRIGMPALVLLLFYVAIGLSDSVHFQEPIDIGKPAADTETVYAGEVLSIFDKLVTPLREQEEKTYSAPLSAYAYAKENMERDGMQVRDFPRLKFGGAHLENPEQERAADVMLGIVLGLLIGLMIWLVFVAVISWVLAQRWQQSFTTALNNIKNQNTHVSWVHIFLTLLVICLLIGIVLALWNKYHILGTDKVGQDVLYQALKSIRTGLVIGTLTTLIMLPFAIMLGIMAGFFRGWVDDVIQYTYTTLNSIPGVLLIAAAVLLMQVYIETHPELFETNAERADLRLFFLCVILGIMSWTGLCRLLRGEALKLSQVDYVQAATAFGVNNFKIIWRHIQPNVMHIVLISVVLDFSGLVLAEAVLSYVGVGVDPTMHSWGNMINSARLEMARDPIVWWSLLAAFLFMFTLVLAANLFSDAVRDAFDPRLRKQ
jgi:peptide/nickel transport system permease protein